MIVLVQRDKTVHSILFALPSEHIEVLPHFYCSALHLYLILDCGNFVLLVLLTHKQWVEACDYLDFYLVIWHTFHI